MRPQQKKEAAKKEKLNQLKKGDFIVTNGGVVGKIDKIVNDAEVTVEISSGVIVRMYKNFVAEILDKNVEIPGQKEAKKEKTTKRSKKEELPAEAPIE